MQLSLIRIQIMQEQTVDNKEQRILFCQDFCIKNGGFFLLGHLKERVYSDPVPKTTDQLKNNIRREVKKIKKDTIRAAMDNMLPRIQNVISRKGAWFEKSLRYQLIFYHCFKIGLYLLQFGLQHQ